jgi:hypothetical protein
MKRDSLDCRQCRYLTRGVLHSVAPPVIGYAAVVGIDGPTRKDMHGSHERHLRVPSHHEHFESGGTVPQQQNR